MTKRTTTRRNDAFEREVARRSAEFDRTRMAIPHDAMMEWLKKKVLRVATVPPQARRVP